MVEASTYRTVIAPNLALDFSPCKVHQVSYGLILKHVFGEPNQISVRGVLVSILEKRSDPVFARFESTVLVVPSKGARQLFAQTGAYDVPLGPTKTFRKVEELPGHSQWCVG
jgi:hypothetical protein